MSDPQAILAEKDEHITHLKETISILRTSLETCEKHCEDVRERERRVAEKGKL